MTAELLPTLVPEPHRGQERVLQLRGRVRVAVCGRRFGKTVAAGIAAVRHCVNADKPQRVWWISPIQDQSDRVERELAGWLAPQMKGAIDKSRNGEGTSDAPQKYAVAWEHRKGEHALIFLPNQSRIEFHSAHVPDRLRGAGLHLVIVDEAADVSEYAWKMVIKPMLLDAGGQAMILGTPRGTGNWLHRVYLLGQAPEHVDAYISLRQPTSASPRISAKDLDEFRLDVSPDEYRQEFEAEFIDGVDAVFRNLAACVEGGVQARGRAGEVYITGIDLADARDFTVLCSIGARSERIEGFWRFNNLGWHEQLIRIADHLRRFPGPCVVDATGLGDPLYEAIARPHRFYAHPFKFNAEAKENVVLALQMALDQKTLKLPQIPELINELQAFKRLDDQREGAARYKRFGAPQGLHDDCVMALCLAWWGLKHGLWGGHGGNALWNAGLFA